jgi:DNA-directed RNA polymerase specialized sigma24 family protein
VSLGDTGSGDGDDDVARFTSLYRRHYPKVLGYALAHAQRSVAEDIANETFLTAWRKLDQMPGDDPLPWLFGVAEKASAQAVFVGSQTRVDRRPHRPARASRHRR